MTSTALTILLVGGTGSIGPNDANNRPIDAEPASVRADLELITGIAH